MPLFILLLKVGLCGAHGRRFGSMHLFLSLSLTHTHTHIYILQTKNWIHGDDRSYELIKTVHVFGKWMTKIKHFFHEYLCPLFGKHKDMAIDLLLFFSWTYMCAIFFNTWTFMCPYIFFLFLSFFERTCPFCNNTGERDHYTWSFILWIHGMEYLTSSIEV
jgi:hypothetical protein